MFILAGGACFSDKTGARQQSQRLPLTIVDKSRARYIIRGGKRQPSTTVNH